MSILGYVVIAIARVIGLIINLYTFIVVIAVLLSWVKPDPYNPIVRILYQLTSPVFLKVRRFTPRFFYKVGIDVTPIIVLIILILIETIIVNTLFDLGRSLIGHVAY